MASGYSGFGVQGFWDSGSMAQASLGSWQEALVGWGL